MIALETKVRLATLDDAEELSRLNQEFNGGDRRPSDEICNCMIKSNEIIAVTENNGKIVGFGCAQSFESFCYKDFKGEITELYIEESSRRKGLARSLISCLEENLRKRGVKSIKVLTGKLNAIAISTYENCSYVRDDELLLKKKLID